MWKSWGAPSCWNNMPSGPSSSKIGRGVLPSCLRKLWQSQYFRQSKKPRTLVVFKKHKTFSTLYSLLLFNYFMIIVALPHSHVTRMSIIIFGYMEYRFVTEYNLGCKTFIFKSWKRVTAKCVANFSVLCSYMLHHLVPIALTFQTFPRNFMQYCVWNVCWAECLGILHGTTNEGRSDFIHFSFSDFSPFWAFFLQMQRVCSDTSFHL
jgi:hypothetical protein